MLKKIANSNFGRAAALTALLTIPFSASADDQGCAPLKKINGYTLSAGASALSYSETHKGTIAISTTPGVDVGNVPKILAGVFKKKGLDAECFVNQTSFESGGTEFRFYVAGLPVTYNGETTFGINDLKNNNDILGAVAAQAKTSRLLASSQNPSITLANN